MVPAVKPGSKLRRRGKRFPTQSLGVFSVSVCCGEAVKVRKGRRVLCLGESRPLSAISTGSLEGPLRTQSRPEEKLPSHS